MTRCFFDSNVLLYMVSSDDAKADRADQLMQEGGWISVQVLNEIANVSRRKMRHEWRQTHALLASVQQFLEVSDLSMRIHQRGIAIAERYGLSTFDSMIAGSAIDLGCDVLYSEDMHHGLVIEGRLRITNPFHA